MKNGGKMSNSVYLFKIGKGNVVLRGYSTDKDLMHAVNDIKRVLMHLSYSSVYDVIKELSPYRERLAKGENWRDEE